MPSCIGEVSSIGNTSRTKLPAIELHSSHNITNILQPADKQSEIMPPSPLISCRQSRFSLILDWDGTLTTSDTLAVLAAVGYSKTRPPSKPWSSIVSAYLDDFQTHASNYPTPPKKRNTFTAERAWLRSLRPVEETSAARATSAGVFRGVGRESMADAARRAVDAGEVKLRRGWEGMFLRSLGAGVSMDVVSVNWSRCFVMECLRASAVKSEQEVEVMKSVESCRVFANEMADVEAVKTGVEVNGERQGGARNLRTSEDKLKQMMELSTAKASEEGQVVVYVGDSTTDLECLVAADVGVVIRDQVMGSSQQDLAQTCERIGLSVKKLCELDRASRRRENEASDCLWWIEDFEDLDKWLKKVMRERE